MLASLALALPPTVGAQDTEPGEAPVRIRLVTMGPGALVWERFGHNALAVHDPDTGLDLAYNWGMFSFDQPGFLGRLLRGTMMYWMAPFETDPMISAYVAADRSVWVQELALTPEQARELRVLLAVNALPENRFYRYDYYRDNCSTRVRDALDVVLDGRLRAALEGEPTGTTYRGHTRRLLSDMPAMYTGIQLVLSGKADRPIDRWEEAFLPIQLMEALREVRVPDGAGGERPLVVAERELYRSAGTVAPTDAPSRLPVYLAGGILFAVALGLLAREATWARVPFALLGAGWSFAAGIGGTILLGAWVFTDHVFWYPNWNLLQLNPLGLALGGLLLPLLVRARVPRVAVRLALGVAALSAVGVLARLLPGVEQRNAEILAFTVPVHLGLAVALFRLQGAGAVARLR